MENKINAYIAEITAFEPKNAEELENFRIRFLGRKGIIGELFEEFKTVTPEQKRVLGKVLNECKQAAENKLEVFKNSFNSTTVSENKQDLSLPSHPAVLGSRHPITLVRQQIVDIFSRIGFTVADGPEIEDDWHIFTALNFPEEHPARDMQDTFFIETKEGDRDSIALRTHTSSVQVRLMENNKPPLRSIMPGRVYRNEAISARSLCTFHQVEGLYIDKGVSFADMKQTLLYFTTEMFGKSEIRLRPSYFPFTEPSAEMDVYWGLETETDYRITKGTGWLEIMGCGMVDPNVLENCGIDSTVYSGFAFGMGIERIALLKYQIPDIRMLYENDMRFLRQFKSEIV